MRLRSLIRKLNDSNSPEPEDQSDILKDGNAPQRLLDYKNSLAIEIQKIELNPAYRTFVDQSLLTKS